MNHKPAGFTAVTPYLSVRDPESLIRFIKNVFHGELVDRHDEGGELRHGRMKIDDAQVELSGASDQWPATPAALHVYVPDVDATHALALENGGVELMPPTDQPYGERGSAVRDSNGNNWYIATRTGDC